MEMAPPETSSKAATATAAERFPCQFVGCSKSFSRKEHLIRHAQSHSDSTRHVCRVCLREFTRNDSLQRHLVRHGDAFKPSPSTRSKRACVACHASKVKCDGDKNCSRCIKKGVECFYDQEAHKEDVSSNEPSDEVLNSGSTDPILEPPSDNSGAFHPQAPSDQEIISTEIAKDPPVPPKPGSCAHATNRMEWVMSARVEKNPTVSSRVKDDNLPKFSEDVVKRYTDVYLAHFHHRWPIFHAPTFEADGPTVLWSSILMIGSWLSDNQESKNSAIEMYGQLSDLVLHRLSQICPSDVFQESLPAILCQAALLIIIFGLYCGRETTLSKAAILESTLVTVLREVGFFAPEIPYDKPMVFAAFRVIKTQERQRMAAYLFKIDSYLSVLRCQPPVLKLEEMYFSLPWTFALYNGLGLHVWEVRQGIEPEVREKHNIQDLIQNIAPDAIPPEDGLMLIEDIQLGLCGLQSSIWHLSDELRRNLNTNTAMQREFLKARLESWKRLLFRLPFSQDEPATISTDIHMAMRFYYGFEDHEEPGWKSKVFARPRSLFVDALMLYHLLSIHLYADIRILRQITQDISKSDLLKVYGATYEKAKLKRESGAIAWTQAKYARRALCHSAATLVLYNNLPCIEKKMVDLIAFVALSASSLVVWAYCTFGDLGCDACTAEVRMERGLHDVELTRWAEAQNDDVLAKERELWIEGGGGRITLAGMEMCRCHMECLILKFRSHLPDGWEGSKYEKGLI